MNIFDAPQSSQNMFDSEVQDNTPFDSSFLGIAVNTVEGLPHAAMQVGGAILHFLKEVGQGIVRSVVATGDTIALDASRALNILSGKGDVASQKFETVHIPNWLQWATGSPKVENLGTQALNAINSIKNSPFAQRHGFDKFATPLGIAGISISTGLDLTPFGGGEKAVAEGLVKATTEESAAKILRKIGTDPELIKVFAPKFAETSSLQEIKDGLNILKGAQSLKAGTLISDAMAKKEATGVVSSAIESATSPDLAPLADIISRSNTFEEFKSTLVDNPRLTSLFESHFKSEDELKAFFEESKPYLSTIEQEGKVALPKSIELPNPAADTLLKLSDEEKAAFKPIINDVAKTVKNKAHIMDYAQTPEFVLEKLGLAKEGKLLQDAKYAYKKELKEQIGKVTSWFNEVKGIPDAAKNIFKYLDGQEGVELVGVEKKVADEMKVYLKEWADRLNLPEDKRIASYITHLFEPDFIQKEFDPEMAKLITDKVAGSVYDPFLEKRLGKMGYQEDAFAALDAYVKRATRKVNFDPALEALKKASESLDVESTKYIQRLTSRVNLRPTEVDTLVDNLFKSVFGYKAGVRPVAKLTGQVRQWIYRGTLGLNLGSALRNLTQGANTYAKLGEKYSVIGYSKLFYRLTTRNLDELFEHGILDDALIEDRKLGVYKSLLQKFDGTLFKFFDLAEKINRGAAYFGAKSKGLAQGMTEAEAVDFGRRIVRETQFAFGNVDTPLMLSSDLAKLGFQLQSYNFKQIEFLKNMVKNKEFAGLIRFSAASIGMVYTIGQMFGMKPSDIIPTVRFGGSPFGNFFSGLYDMVAGNAQEKTQAKQKFGATLSAFVPAGSQIRKTIQGIEAFNKGKDTTATGRTRYKIEQTPGNAFRAALFGKSSLPAAQEYYDSIGKKKKKTAAPAGGNIFDQ
jgi:hypothetical protein